MKKKMKKVLSSIIVTCFVFATFSFCVSAVPPTNLTGNNMYNADPLVFLNGIPIIITAGTTPDKTIVYLDKGTIGTLDVADEVVDLASLNYSGVPAPTGDTTNGFDLSDTYIYAGCNSETVASGRITMLGGNVYQLCASSAGWNGGILTNATIDFRGGTASYVYGNYDSVTSNIKVSGGTILQLSASQGAADSARTIELFGSPTINELKLSTVYNSKLLLTNNLDSAAKITLKEPSSTAVGTVLATANAGVTINKNNFILENQYLKVDGNNLVIGVAPTITSVDITSPPSSVKKNTKTNLSALVTGTEDFSSDVTWTVEQGVAGTTIDSNGILTIDPNETATKLKITATSTQDTTKSKTIYITIEEDSIPLVTDSSNNNNDNPKTADESQIAGMALISIASIAGIIEIERKKKTERAQ